MEAPLVQHFLEVKCSPEDFKLVELVKIVQRSDNRIDLHKLLLQQEMFWIFRLKTLVPKGLNVEIDYSEFLYKNWPSTEYTCDLIFL